MRKNLEPVRCGCGGEAIIYINGACQAKIYCKKCGIESNIFATKYEAITAWNKAMGERMAKVEDLEKRSETSLSWEGICKNCGSYTMHEMDYCFGCGARLEWE